MLKGSAVGTECHIIFASPLMIVPYTWLYACLCKSFIFIDVDWIHRDLLCLTKMPFHVPIWAHHIYCMDQYAVLDLHNRETAGSTRRQGYSAKWMKKHSFLCYV